MEEQFRIAKIASVALIVFWTLLILLIAMPVDAQTPEPDLVDLRIPGLNGARDWPRAQERIDQAMDRVWRQIQRRQGNYKSQTGRFFQGLPTHANAPANGSENYPERFLQSPTDQRLNWYDAGFLPYSPMGYQARMDVYDGPMGAGYVFCLRIVWEGTTYERCYNYGPDGSYGHGWQEVSE